MSDDATRKLELLKLARTIVNEEYINRRAEEHNRWVALNDHSLRTTKVRTPYPPFTTYPSEDVLIAKALAMYNFISAPAQAGSAPIREPLPLIEEPTLDVAAVESAPIVEQEPVTATMEDPAIAELLDQLASAQERIPPIRPMLVAVPAPVEEPVAIVESLALQPELATETADTEFEESHLLPGWVKGWIRK